MLFSFLENDQFAPAGTFEELDETRSFLIQSGTNTILQILKEGSKIDEANACQMCAYIMRFFNFSSKEKFYLNGYI